ncbi:hypothetical protein CK203_006531 [Vitis vinifera]|uniref:Retrovirus-related Pol polyprotein from transposon TNT 1-94 n=1 Tax=Vitis vinifera TaxID=29760 RepID=A0A438KAW7_VITVI|nr:hypothetical protein CK203_006531 [Vitis vinifera]
MFITMDVVFHEDSMYFSFESELQGEYQKEIQTLDYDYHISEDDGSEQSELVNQEASGLDMSVTTLEPSSNDHPETEEVIEKGRNTIPNSVQEALTDPRWKIAMNEEMKSLQKNETWELVEYPPRKKPVGCR